MKQIQIKTKWEEVTVEEFIQIQKIIESDKNDIKKQIDIISILSNESVNDIEDLCIDDFKNLSNSLSFVFDPINVDGVKDTFTFNDKEWKIITDFNKLTVGEIASIESFVKDKPLTDYFTDVLTVFIREANKKRYDSDNYNEYKNIFKSIPITYCYNVIFFFLNGIK